MKKKNTIVKAPVELKVLKNQASEMVNYLNVDFSGLYSIETDIKNGALQFVELEKLIEKKRLSRIVVVSADSKEMGLIGISYLAMSVNEDTNPYFYEETFDYGNGENEWLESPFKIPIIGLDEIKHYYLDDNGACYSGGLAFETVEKKEKLKPYWLKCQSESICILVEKEKIVGDWLNLLQTFPINKHIYVLFVNETEAEPYDIIPFETIDSTHFNRMRNNFILSNAADAVNISFSGASSRRYYRNVFKNNIEQRGIRLKKGFSYDRPVELAESINPSKVCELIDKTIEYAVKDIDDVESVVLDNDSFEFINNFLDADMLKKQRKGKELLEEQIIGLDDIKRQVLDVVNVMKFNKMRAEMNIHNGGYHNVHLMLGAPGTAKTTIATYMGQMMVDEKLLPDNRVICINGAELKGKYVGHSAPQTKMIFEKNDVIIIDEAYSIVDSNGEVDTFGNEAIAQMIIELEKHSTDKLVIFAGYGGQDVDEKDNKMKNFLDANPGIKSRITSTFYFKSYSAEDMWKIFKHIAKTMDYSVPNSARKMVEDYFKTRVDAPDFGNGREARALLENTTMFAAKRIMSLKKEEYTASELKKLTMEDIEKALKQVVYENRNERKNNVIGFTI